LNIFINDEQVKFSLENEKYVGQVFTAVEKWLGENNFFVSEIYIDSEEVFATRKDVWEQTEIKEVQDFSIKAITVYEQRYQSLQILVRYFDQFILSLQQDDQSIINQYSSEFTYIHDSLTGLLGDGKDKTIADNLQETFNGSFGEKGVDPARKQKLIADFTGLLAILNARIREIEHPVREAESCYQEIERISERFPEISLYLQTGKDNEAMGIIIVLTEYLQKIIRIMMYHPSAEVLKENSDSGLKELNEKMNELLEAFEAEDTILIGDLIEYELMDTIKHIPDMINILKKG